jgi:hypothetical protein
MFSEDPLIFAIGNTVASGVLIYLTVALAAKDINNPKYKKSRSKIIALIVFLSIFIVIFLLFAVAGAYMHITKKTGTK